ncbi:unnamed protein product, partial [Darwinula stevensoni]
SYGADFLLNRLKEAEITAQGSHVILDLIEKMLTYLANATMTGTRRLEGGLQRLSNFLQVVYAGNDMKAASLKAFKVFVQEEEIGGKLWQKKKICKSIHFWCFNPGIGLERLSSLGVHSLIMTSGTLAPLDTLQAQLKVPFSVTLENPHIVGENQVFAGIIPKGPDGTLLSSSYENRKNPAYVGSLGQTILNVARVSPGGMLVFFPSYAALKSSMEAWQDKGTWSSLQKIKPIFVEPVGKDGLIETMQEFSRLARDTAGKGALFLAVCRGKVSEGLDFADDLGRTVVITGLPYPPMMDPRVVLKKSFLDESRTNGQSLTGGEWYRLEASRAVNQAIGRVIRHRDDYGAILLCDARFQDSNFKSRLSSWIRPRLAVHSEFGKGLRSIAQFFSAAHKISSSRIQKLEPQSGSVTIHERRKKSSTSKLNEEKDTNCMKQYYREESQEGKSGEYKDLFEGLIEAKPTSLVGFLGDPQGSDTVPVASTTVSTHLNSVAQPPKRRKIKMIPNAPAEKPLLKMENHVKEPDKMEASKNFLSQARKTLLEQEYKAFSMALKMYQQSKKLNELMSVLKPLVSQDSTKGRLFYGLTSFLTAAHRQPFEKFIDSNVNSRQE